MNDNVIPIGTLTYLDLQPDKVLEGAMGLCADGVVVLGREEDGTLYFASSYADGAKVVWLLEMAKKHLLDNVDKAI